MRKILLLTTALCAMLLFWSTALAADIGGIAIVSRDDAVALSLLDAAGKTVTKQEGTEQYPGATRLQIIVPNAVSGAEYLLTTQDAEGNPTEENLVFIDQRRSAEGGSITFTVYPSRAALEKTYYVYLSSASDNRAMVVSFRYFEEEVIAKEVMGDVTGDGNVQVNDAQTVLQILVDILDRSSLTAEQLTCADVNKNGLIDVDDAVKILQFVAEVIDTLG